MKVWDSGRLWLAGLVQLILVEAFRSLGKGIQPHACEAIRRAWSAGGGPNNVSRFEAGINACEEPRGKDEAMEHGRNVLETAGFCHAVRVVMDWGRGGARTPWSWSPPTTRPAAWRSCATRPGQLPDRLRVHHGPHRCPRPRLRLGRQRPKCLRRVDNMDLFGICVPR
jgi:hypothetical protein